MSIASIHQYYNRVDDLVRYSGKDNENIVSREFQFLIGSYCEKRNLKLIPEFSFLGKNGKTIRPDGTIKNALRIDYGYWESKSKKHNLEEEIYKKFKSGYPGGNTLFENSQIAILYQDGKRIMEVDIRNDKDLDKLLTAFTTYEHTEVKKLNKAIENFKKDIPKIAEALREMIEKEEKTNEKFNEKRQIFWDLCKSSINPNIRIADINEMLIQHILTEEIFISFFSESQFHQENNIARELYEIEKTFFTGTTKRNLLDNIRYYYEFIKEHSITIIENEEKHKFLNAIYENFYKAYNPKGADRLGIIYTPTQIVKFMIESTDFLLEKHFGKKLSQPNVDILEPSMGTGTFIRHLIKYIPKQYLAHKYKNEIHGNEIAILPYYIGNLNIEQEFKNKMGYYEEFKNSCFVDTLDNIGGLSYGGKQHDMFGFSAENAGRIKKQNDKKISVIIGNPPYNARQDNFNSQNANRLYKDIDKRIKDTYIKEGTAQNQNVLYDMYTRFFRWASDRLNENGVLAFVSNNVFIDALSYDGFRKVVGKEFNEIYVINLKGNARTSGERRRSEGGNIFSNDVRVGIAVYFFIKNKDINGCQLYYNEIKDYAKLEEKKAYLRDNKLEIMPFEKIIPDLKGNWINLSNNDFEKLLPLIEQNKDSIFKNSSLGVDTHRDAWVYDFNEKNLSNKMRFFIKTYNETLKNKNYEKKSSIAWARELTKYLDRGISIIFNQDNIKKSLHRPYVLKYHYFDKYLNSYLFKFPLYNNPNENKIISFNRAGNTKDFFCLSTKYLVDLHTTGDSQCLPIFYYENDERKDNISDWALEQFLAHYQGVIISKENIFHYVYAVLHNPAYRSKYELNLKREFPRIPFYTDFAKWAKWGQDLMALHIDYETVPPYALVRKDIESKKAKKSKGELFADQEQLTDLMSNYEMEYQPKPKLKANKEEGKIEIDGITTLLGIPAAAWEYKLGNRCALEWILDQYKESKPSDVTIADKFNNYKFADYKESVIELLMRVCTVSVETQKIVSEMNE